ncbi:MAG: hypothetical protein ACK4I8_10300 [Armatimonadota bacterium]
MQRSVPTWLAVVLIAVTIGLVIAMFMFSGRQQGQKMPEGFKPSPPMFKEAPVQKR